jgi:lipoprotein-anchoring transpeptidase ErfK/SrfK
MYRPKYFWRSAAIHGYASVPNYAASHGCVRVTNATMDWLWKKNALPLGMPIWVY